MKQNPIKKAIFTVCIGEDTEKLAELTHPRIKAYANRVGADFIVTNKHNIYLNRSAKFEKFQIYELLKKYDRIIYLDSDILVNSECPNLFDIVPSDKFGAFIVSKYTGYHNKSNHKIQEVLQDITWERETHNKDVMVSFNSGVMVVSQHHVDVFNTNSNLLEKWSFWHSCNESGIMVDQTLINYTVQKLRIPIYDIGYKFNHTIASKNSQERFNSYIIHYAGISHRDGNRLWQIDRLSKIKNDLFIMEHNFIKSFVCRFPSLIRPLDLLFDVQSFFKKSLSINQVKSITKNILKRALPPSIQTLYRNHKLARQLEQENRNFIKNLKANYSYDFERFYKYSAAKAGGGLYSMDGIKSQTNLKALMTMEYHRIEKGLSLKEPRTGFGTDTISRLIYGIKTYQQLYEVYDETVDISINTLLAYYKFNLELGHEDKKLYETILFLKDNIAMKQATLCVHGGIMKVKKEHIISDSCKDLKAFFSSRYSIRNFAPTEVDMSLIEQSVEMAQKTPSVCNRQSSKVYVFSNEEDKKRVLSYQNGNRGFGEQASKVLIVASDLQNFASIKERNQCWIDGGMYAMSLIYALHSLGLGTCCLNWSVEYQVDKQLREAAGISDSEVVIMMIAVGHIPDELMVAQSPRKKVNEVLVIK